MIDMAIKREYRQNNQRMAATHLADMANTDNTRASKRLKTFLKVFHAKHNSNKDVEIEPERFTTYLQSLESDTNHLEISKLDPSNPLRVKIQQAIVEGKTGKTPGPDGVYTEMLQAKSGMMSQ